MTKSASRQKSPRSLEQDLPSIAGLSLPDGAPPMCSRTRPFWAASGRHDIDYISSLVHDAEFKLEDIYESDQWLVIPIDRQRWELPHEAEIPAIHVRSELLVGPVKWWTVELAGRSFLGKDFLHLPELTIFGIQCSMGKFIVEQVSDEEIVIDCTSAKIKIRGGEDGEIRMVDLPPKRKKKRDRPISARCASPMG